MFFLQICKPPPANNSPRISVWWKHHYYRTGSYTLCKGKQQQRRELQQYREKKQTTMKKKPHCCAGKLMNCPSLQLNIVVCRLRQKESSAQLVLLLRQLVHALKQKMDISNIKF